MKWLLILFTALPVFGQLPVIPFNPVVSAPVIPGPTNINGGAFRWWVSSDVTVGVTVSNQWLDRIVSARAWQMDTTKSPTNRLGGVRFNGAQSLTNISFEMGNHNGDGKGTVFLIFTYDANGNQFLAAQNDGRGPAIDASGNFKYWGGGITAVIAPVPAAKTNDVAIVYNISSTAVIYYTNGVPALTNAASSINQEQFGNANGTFPLTGELTEMIYYTNALSSADISAIHKYGTNLYNYTP